MILLKGQADSDFRQGVPFCGAEAAGIKKSCRLKLLNWSLPISIRGPKPLI